MADESRRSPSFDPSVVDRLACPACLGKLRLEEGALVCAACGRTYPVIDGIPVLIADRAAEPSH